MFWYTYIIIDALKILKSFIFLKKVPGSFCWIKFHTPAWKILWISYPTISTCAVLKQFLQIFGHSCRLLIVGGAESGKTNGLPSLLHHQPETYW